MEGDSNDSADSALRITPQLLADLQAGLLDDDTAARVRRQVRDDPAGAQVVAALDRVRSDLAELGADTASAPDVPDDVAARVDASLRAVSTAAPAHAARRPMDRIRLIMTGMGAAAALTAVAVGTAMLFRAPAPRPPAGPTVETITVGQEPVAIPLSDPEMLGLLTRQPDMGPLADPQRRASCLSGLGYPSTAAIVGARPLVVGGRDGILLLLNGVSSHTFAALVVAPNCSSANTGLLAETVVTRP